MRVSNSFVAPNRRGFLMGASAALALAGGPGGVWASGLTGRFGFGSPGYGWAVAYIADDVGAWTDAGITLSVQNFPSGRESMQALLANSLEFATSTDTPVVFSALGGLRPIILASYSRYSRDMKIVVRKDRGIDPDAPASIRGKTIATRMGTSAQYVLSRYLVLAGLAEADIKVVDLPPADMITAAVNGDVDGFVWSTQSAALASERSQGATATMNDDELPRYFRSHQLLLTNERVVSEQPELLAPAVAGILAAGRYILTKPDWVDLVAERVKADVEIVRAATDDFEFDVRLDEAFLNDLVDQAEWAIAQGLAEKPEGDLRALLRGLIYEKPLAELAPDKVSL